jgi:hypothetical protein
MDADRKYRQRGYMDGFGQEERSREQRQPRGPRQPIDVTGPRLPRMVQTVVATRCYNCATTLSAAVDFNGDCPKCNAPLHCCKQCAHFEPGQRLQCMKPIRTRIASKDKVNDCELFSSRVTVARDAAAVPSPQAVSNPAPRRQQDARAAFDNLFKK